MESAIRLPDMTRAVTIDGIWSSIQGACVNQELAGHGDHSIAEAVFSFSRKDRRGTQFRFSHTRRLKENAVESAIAPVTGALRRLRNSSGIKLLL